MASNHPKPLLGTLIDAVFLDAQRRLELRLAEAGFPEVRAAQVRVLELVREGHRASELAELAPMAKQSMAEHVAHLLAHHLIEREQDPSDKRARLVRLTDRGRRALAVARGIRAEFDEAWEAQLGQKRFRTLQIGLGELLPGPLRAGPEPSKDST